MERDCGRYPRFGFFWEEMWGLNIDSTMRRPLRGIMEKEGAKMMKKRILCYGDSNTYGYNPMGGRYDEDSRWPMVMQSALGEGYRVVEEGFNGRTFSQDDPTEGGFKSGVAYLPPCLMTHNPLDLVMVMLGTNDTKQRFGLSAQAIAHNLKEFVRIVRSYALDELGRPPKILVIAPPLIGDWLEGTIFYGHFGPEAPAKSRELSRQMRRYAKLLGCGYFDGAQCASPCKADAVHLMPDQQRKLGLALADKAREMLG